jgi:hypothetical protein
LRRRHWRLEKSERQSKSREISRCYLVMVWDSKLAFIGEEKESQINSYCLICLSLSASFPIKRTQTKGKAVYPGQVVFLFLLPIVVGKAEVLVILIG